ncbi:hypothetical protein AVEN_4061-1 [Araneus ventricosus]|uniref:Uncharacterized protein n=1 Tax=Araneus ventricosus TaxID=182803 RepID=A0A4Y2MEK7_ARAVE|nr:hypothetical protein AVEN_4061-1 [Araneus ventricosus]
MVFLAKAEKVDLLSQAAEVGLDVKRAKVSEELWVSHLIGLLPNDMAQLVARELEDVTEDYEQTAAYKRLAEQKKEACQLRNTFSKGKNTKEVRKFRISKVLASYVSTPRNSDVTAKTNETINQLRTINEKKRIQRSKFSDVQSPATSTCTTSTCTSVNDTKIKSVTKISKRQNKYRFSVNAIEKSHFLHSEVISEEKGNEALDTISLVKCQESGNKAFSIKTISDINQEIIEDVEFGSETEKENQTSFRENKLTEEDELISDY